MLLHGCISHLQLLQNISMLAMQTSSFLLKMLRSELSPVEHCRRARTGILPVAQFSEQNSSRSNAHFFCSVLDRKRTIKLLKAFLFHLHQFWLVVAVSLQTLNWSSAPSLPSVSSMRSIFGCREQGRNVMFSACKAFTLCP